MSFNSGSRIPSELYPLIVEYIDDKTTLLSMLVSTRVASAAVERKLYHRVEFDDQNDRKHICFLESVLDPKRAHLSGLVFRYSCTRRLGGNAIHHALIKRALVTFTNLKQLRFIITDVDEETLASLLPIERPPFKLELFQWLTLKKANRDVGITRFIASQPSLKTLNVQDISAGLSQISLQNLQSLNDLSGSVSTILPLLPRSVPINRIHWNANVSQDLRHFPVLSSVRVLSIDPQYSQIPPLSDIFGRFQNIEALALPSLGRDELLDLYRFPLRTLVLSSSYIDGATDTIEEIFWNMKLLRYIFVPAGRYTRQPYLRWERYAETAVPVSERAIETTWWRRL